MENEVFKQISIRGRFAYGLCFLEFLLKHFNTKNTLLEDIVNEFWYFTNLEKVGEMEGFFYTRDPVCVIVDFPEIKLNPQKMI
ncbi:hypothetical protein [Emticicia sp.]|uniref:hypothetical protein n=1 Tax=Emticicia sp. TaxID=1930953 RepID=UPI003750925B